MISSANEMPADVQSRDTQGSALKQEEK